ncbi:RIP metalloprotease RseP [candidate division KSB1 bacterium]|nr:RIP metalloprotease RseP [candidate division KSB1 bacterium]
MIDSLNSIGIQILRFIFVLGILIFVHELGHFILAKLTGIRVERFSLGYPPRMIGKQIGETDYCISWVPLGGYVKLSGMIDESLEQDSVKGEPWEFMSKPIWQRFLVILAGPFMNVFFTFAIISAFAYFAGLPQQEGHSSKIGSVLEGKPAAIAGLQAGDEIIEISGSPVSTWEDIVKNIGEVAQKQAIAITWKRDGEIMSSTVTPYYDSTQNKRLIGIGSAKQEYSLAQSVSYGFNSTWKYTGMIFNAIGEMITGKVEIRKSLAGPVSIYKMVQESADVGFEWLIYFTAMLSLNLGIFNLLPIPVLDGGHLVYLTIEAIIRRPISTKTKLIVQQIGMALLLILIVLVTYNDFTR